MGIRFSLFPLSDFARVSMGIRFACHVCGRRLNIKQELAGKRGICPVCAAKIRIPLSDTEKSTPVDDQKPVSVASGVGQSPSAMSATARPHTDAAIAGGASTSLVSPAPVSSGAPDIDLLQDEPEVAWYVRPPSGGQYGPATTEVLRQWIDEGRVASNALLWREGWSQWRDAADALPEYSGRLPDSRATGASPAAPDSPPGQAAVPSSSRRNDEKPVEQDDVLRSRSVRRMLTIGALSVLALSLILALAFVASR